jgi:hypothetical protein
MTVASTLKKVRVTLAGPKTACAHQNLKNVRVLGSARK